MTADHMQPTEPAASQEQPSTPARRFIQLAPDRYMVYISGMRFMVDAETAGLLGCTVMRARSVRRDGE
jgi:hypothetical protein